MGGGRRGRHSPCCHAPRDADPSATPCHTDRMKTLRLTDDEITSWRRRWLVRGFVLGTLAFLPGVLLGVSAAWVFFAEFGPFAK